MKVSVLWLGLFLVTIVLVWATVQGYFLHESFKGSQDSKVAEGFSGTSEDIRVSGCPSSTTTFINSKGHTICCDGPILDGKCSGREVCSLSQGANLPTCSEYKTAWLDEKGAKKCPRALPNYFENPNGVGGCTSGPRNQDGSAPENPFACAPLRTSNAAAPSAFRSSAWACAACGQSGGWRLPSGRPACSRPP